MSPFKRPQYDEDIKGKQAMCKLCKESEISILGYPLGGQNVILTRKNMRNELLSNYHKMKKIREIMTLKTEKVDFRPEKSTFHHRYTGVF